MTQAVSGVVRHVPNALTIARIVMVPVVLAVLLWRPDDQLWRWLATGLFSVAMLTDFVDGFLARRWQVVSAFGKLADPIADKIMVVGLLLGLAWLDEVPWVMAGVVVAREVLVTVGRLLVASKSVVAAGWSGKVKTAAQTVGLFMMLAPWSWLWSQWHAVALVVLWLATVLTVFSGLVVARSLVQGAMRRD